MVDNEITTSYVFTAMLGSMSPQYEEECVKESFFYLIRKRLDHGSISTKKRLGLDHLTSHCTLYEISIVREIL